jgi:arylsulfatase A-like enzyme
MTFVPKDLTHDQIREVNALTHVENELIDEACGRVLRRIAERGWDVDTDVFFTTDHGELQGDFGLLYKGPYHVDALMRIPLVWHPAPSAGVAPASIEEPVGQLDLAPTFCAIAGVPVPDWMEGAPLPAAPGSGRTHVVTEWDSQFKEVGMHLRTIYRDGFICTVYEPTTRDRGWELGRMLAGGDVPLPDLVYDGTEGELYDVAADPHQWRNLWNDPGYAKRRAELVAELYASLPRPRAEPLRVEAPA